MLAGASPGQACFLSATAGTCLPASTLRRPAPGPRWPAASGPGSLTAGKPQARPIPAAPLRPRPGQPPGRRAGTPPAHREPGPPSPGPRPRTPAGSQREPRRTVRLTEHRARRKLRGRGLAARPFRPWVQIAPFGPGRTAMPPAGLPRRRVGARLSPGRRVVGSAASRFRSPCGRNGRNSGKLFRWLPWGSRPYPSRSEHGSDLVDWCAWQDSNPRPAA